MDVCDSRGESVELAGGDVAGEVFSEVGQDVCYFLILEDLVEAEVIEHLRIHHASL